MSKRSSRSVGLGESLESPPAKASRVKQTDEVEDANNSKAGNSAESDTPAKRRCTPPKALSKAKPKPAKTPRAKAKAPKARQPSAAKTPSKTALKQTKAKQSSSESKEEAETEPLDEPTVTAAVEYTVPTGETTAKEAPPTETTAKEAPVAELVKTAEAEAPNAQPPLLQTTPIKISELKRFAPTPPTTKIRVAADEEVQVKEIEREGKPKLRLLSFSGEDGDSRLDLIAWEGHAEYYAPKFRPGKVYLLRGGMIEPAKAGSEAKCSWKLRTGMTEVIELHGEEAAAVGFKGIIYTPLKEASALKPDPKASPNIRGIVAGLEAAVEYDRRDGKPGGMRRRLLLADNTGTADLCLWNEDTQAPQLQIGVLLSVRQAWAKEYGGTTTYSKGYSSKLSYENNSEDADDIRRWWDTEGRETFLN